MDNIPLTILLAYRPLSVIQYVQRKLLSLIKKAFISRCMIKGRFALELIKGNRGMIKKNVNGKRKRIAVSPFFLIYRCKSPSVLGVFPRLSATPLQGDSSHRYVALAILNGVRLTREQRESEEV